MTPTKEGPGCVPAPGPSLWRTACLQRFDPGLLVSLAGAGSSMGAASPSRQRPFLRAFCPARTRSMCNWGRRGSASPPHGLDRRKTTSAVAGALQPAPGALSRSRDHPSFQFAELACVAHTGGGLRIQHLATRTATRRLRLRSPSPLPGYATRPRCGLRITMRLSAFATRPRWASVPSLKFVGSIGLGLDGRSLIDRGGWFDAESNIVAAGA